MNQEMDTSCANFFEWAESKGLWIVDAGEPRWHGAVYLLMAAYGAYWQMRNGQSNAGQRCADRGLTELLGLAYAGGYPHHDILRTLLANGDFGDRAVEMAKVAMETVTAAEIASALLRSGLFEGNATWR